MPLPVSQNTVYAIDTEVKSTDLNEMQQAISRAMPIFFDDFFIISSSLWATTADGAGASIVDVTLGQFGVAKLSTDGTISHAVDIKTPESLGILAGSLPRLRARVLLRTRVTTRLDSVGLTHAGDEYLSFSRNTGSSGVNWFLDVMGGSGAESFDLGFSPTFDVWYVLTAVVIDSTHIAWSIALSETATPLASGTAVLAHAMNSTNPVGAHASVVTLGAFSTSLLVDYISVAQPNRQ